MKLTIRMTVVLTLIALSSAALLSALNQWAEPRIEEHRRARIVQAINDLYPGEPEHMEIATYAEDIPIYACFDATGDTIGFAFQARGTGYSDEIRLMVGLQKNLQELNGIFVLEQTETPGLGARITEQDFRRHFEGLHFDPESPNIGIVDRDPDDREVQAITGATISAEAVVNIINRALPKVRKKIK